MPVNWWMASLRARAVARQVADSGAVPPKDATQLRPRPIRLSGVNSAHRLLASPSHLGGGSGGGQELSPGHPELNLDRREDSFSGLMHG